MTDVLALDLEGTLISNAVTQFPRPGLRDFLDRCHVLVPRLVMFTTVREQRFRTIATTLVAEGSAPGWFQTMEYINWEGPTKDLAFIVGADLARTLLIDDCSEYVHPGQESNWLSIEQFAAPYGDEDRELSRVLSLLQQRLERR
jgi:hypothetical protein